MKRYEMKHDELYDRVFMGESDHGQSHPAEVAKALYDALNTVVMSAPSRGPLWHGSEVIAAARKALSLADGDEQ
jgi:hypothetical protein